jgi:putative acetyltransferase
MMNNPDCYIRPATNDDIPAIKSVVFTVLQEYGLRPDENGKDNDLSDLETNYYADHGYFGVVVKKDTEDIIGTFGLHRVNPTTFELRKMYLAKEFRGQGIGQSMLRKAIATAIEKNSKKIVLETISPLTEAISLYKKYGFTEIAPEIVNDRVDQAFELVL